MNNDNEANDANDNGDGHNVGQPETERQELLRLNVSTGNSDSSDSYCFKNGHDCFWRHSKSEGLWSKQDGFGSINNSYEMISMLAR